MTVLVVDGWVVCSSVVCVGDGGMESVGWAIRQRGLVVEAVRWLGLALR